MSSRQYGHGPQPALAIHCSLAHAGEWSALGATLGDLLTITACDLPGHGSAPDVAPDADVGAAAEVLALAALPKGQADVIGHSFGAVVSLRLALAHPDRVRRLVLIEPTLFAAALQAGATELPPYTAAFLAAVAVGDRERAAQAFTADWGAGSDWSLLPDRQRGYIAERIHLIQAADPVLLQDTSGILAPGRLERLSVPVLILEGGSSPLVIDAIAAALAARLPAAERATVPGAGHMLPVTHVAEVAAVLRRFLSR